MDRDGILNHRFDTEIVTYSDREVMLHGLGLNLGLDPTDPRDLVYVTEPGLQVLPSFAMVLGTQDGWFARPEFGIDMLRVLHAEQRLDCFAALPVAGRVQVAYALTGITDLGSRRGAMLHYRKDLSCPVTGAAWARVVMSVLCRGDGGGGSFGVVPAPLAVCPDRPPDRTVTRRVDPRAALIYRLGGDRNPLHSRPETARAAGFDRPILHGLCTLGMAGHALLETVAGGDPARFGGLAGRFTRPVWPGDILRTEIWQTGDGARFRVVSDATGACVIDRGAMRLRV